MKRRDFFKVFALAGAAAVAPGTALAMARSADPLPVGATLVGKLTEQWEWRVDMQVWMLVTHYRGVDGTRWSAVVPVSDEARACHDVVQNLRRESLKAIEIAMRRRV